MAVTAALLWSLTCLVIADAKQEEIICGCGSLLLAILLLIEFLIPLNRPYLSQEGDTSEGYNKPIILVSSPTLTSIAKRIQYGLEQLLHSNALVAINSKPLAVEKASSIAHKVVLVLFDSQGKNNPTDAIAARFADRTKLNTKVHLIHFLQHPEEPPYDINIPGLKTFYLTKENWTRDMQEIFIKLNHDFEKAIEIHAFSNKKSPRPVRNLIMLIRDVLTWTLSVFSFGSVLYYLVDLSDGFEVLSLIIILFGAIGGSLLLFRKTAFWGGIITILTLLSIRIHPDVNLNTVFGLLLLAWITVATVANRHKLVNINKVPSYLTARSKYLLGK